ncbi:MAG TPA: hypothetical protein VLJ82_00950, partial [Jatrophihabitans sp.]|nr:hypothetical protein [Jatrophihabitans sp.]
PEIFANWEILWCPDLVDSGYAWDYPRASIWQGMNFMMIRPDLAVVSDIQTSLIRELEKRDVTVAPTRLRHSRTLSGGFHCATLDIRRRGSLQDYR